MNINYGDTGLVIKYIQAYLYEYYSNTVSINGRYDENTHNALLKYLNNYNVQTMNTVYNGLQEKFPDLFRYFKVNRTTDSIKFISKYVHDDIKQYISNIESELYKYIKTQGWRVSEFTNYNNYNVTEYIINVTKQQRDNRFPTREAMCMVNQFNGRFYYGLSFIDGGEGGVDGVVHTSSKYKICIINCEPNQTYIISHGYTQPTLVSICCSQFNEQQILKKSKTVDNLVSTVLSAGSPITYTTNSNSKTLIIQIPDTDSFRDPVTIRVPVRLGDVNFDGKIDSKDRDLLSEYIKSSAPIDGINLVACSILQRRDKNNSLYFDNDDLAELDRYLNGEISMLGIGYYDQILRSTGSLESNKLLVIQKNSDEDYNIPFNTYSDRPWMIHDKFLNYILDRTINQYSDSDSIAYLQDLISRINSNYKIKSIGTYDESLRTAVKAYQDSREIPFALGYLDVETEASIITELYREGVNIYEY